MFEANINALQKTNPVLAEKVRAVSLEDARKVVAAGQNEQGEFFIAYNGFPLDHPQAPFEYARALCEKQIPQKLFSSDMVFVYGLSLGYVFKRVYVSVPARIVLYEPILEILRFVLEYVDLASELADKRVFITSDLSQMIDYVSSKYLKNDRIEIVMNEYSQTCFACEAATFLTNIYKALEMKLSDINTAKTFRQLWAKNFIKNIKATKNYKPLNSLSGKFKDKNALIIAAGASLEDDIGIIKKYRNKFNIIAINKSLEFLLQNGVTPDFTIFFDGRGLSLTFKEQPPETIDTNIIMSLYAQDYVTQLNAKNFFLMFSDSEVASLKLQEKYPDSITLTPSSVNSSGKAYFAAKMLGFKNIMFSGLDLAFKEDKQYIGNQNFPINNHKIGGLDIVEVESCKGIKVKTRADYKIFIEQLSELFVNDKSSNLYNFSKIGAKINGMDYVDAETFLKNLGATTDKITVGKGNFKKFNNNLKSFLSEIEEDVLQIKKSLQENQMDLLKLLDKILNNPYLEISCEAELLEVINCAKNEVADISLNKKVEELQIVLERAIKNFEAYLKEDAPKN